MILVHWIFFWSRWLDAGGVARWGSKTPQKHDRSNTK